MSSVPTDTRALIRWSFFQLHWLIGISAGSLLMVIGLTGAILSFEDELLDALNPGVLSVPAQSLPALAPPALFETLGPLPDNQRLTTAIFSAEPGRSVQLLLQARPGQAKPLPLYVDPYTGKLLGPAGGQAFFEWVERLHRFLLLPREPGRVAAGILSSCLLLLIISGIYLRWPKPALNWRAWLSFNPRLKGRPFLWAMHAVLATWALPAWLLLTTTGIYWSFDGVRSTVDGWAGVQRAPRMKREPEAAPPAHPELSLAWQRFQDSVPAWREVRLRLPERDAAALEILWLAPDAAHERQRNRMQIGLDGRLKKDERFAELGVGKRALATIYPLHMGRYFGLPVRILMMLSALALPVLGVTGWVLYLKRRRQRREAEAQRHVLASGSVGGEDAILVAWASQSGRAESLALRTAAALQAAGRSVVVKSLAGFAPAELAGYPQALFVVSTFGEGQAPDGARSFARALDSTELKLAGMRFAVLALGNRQYAQFCAFGHALHGALLRLGAGALQPLTPACETEPAAVDAWFAGLSHFGVDTNTTLLAAEAPVPQWQRWQLVQRRLLNPGSSGEPLFELSLLPVVSQTAVHWAPGALAEIRPAHAEGRVSAWLFRHGFDPGLNVNYAGAGQPLWAVLAASVLPEKDIVDGDLRALLTSLKPLSPRRYSVASIPADGALQLVVRQHRHAGGIGVASGFLTLNCPAGGEVELRVVANPAFTVPAEDLPCIFIGNGSGIAGLRGLLRERMRLGLGRNWLVFGERNRANDMLFEVEFNAWAESGRVEVDRVFSREPGGCYVQDHLLAQAGRLKRWLADGAVIHVCGSLSGMASGVDATLESVIGRDALEALAAAGRYRRDVY